MKNKNTIYRIGDYNVTRDEFIKNVGVSEYVFNRVYELKESGMPWQKWEHLDFVK